MQNTLNSAVNFTGVGLHSGEPVSMTVHPARADHGVVFERSDIPGAAGRIQARWNMVRSTRLCTLIGNDGGATISTIEHVMAALAGCGIHNARVVLNGPEVPILDGSAAQFVRGFMAAGIRALDRPVMVLRVLQSVEVREGVASARLDPAEAMSIDFSIEFAASAIGAQHKMLPMANGAFVRELSDSRTFALEQEIESLRAHGLARGGSLENAVVVAGDRILTPGGLRHADEPVRHKMLDALGDLSLAGGPILGRYTGYRAGHGLTNQLLRALFARPDAWEWVECAPATEAHLPGVGVTPADLPRAA